MSWLARLFRRGSSEETRIRVAAEDALERASGVTDRLQAHADQRRRDVAVTRRDQMHIRRDLRQNADDYVRLNQVVFGRPPYRERQRGEGAS